LCSTWFRVGLDLARRRQIAPIGESQSRLQIRLWAHARGFAYPSMLPRTYAGFQLIAASDDPPCRPPRRRQRFGPVEPENIRIPRFRRTDAIIQTLQEKRRMRCGSGVGRPATPSNCAGTKWPGRDFMGKARLEAFSDGVIAIIITIMVLDLKIPPGADLQAVATVTPVFLNYVLSFLYVAIYWNNHHHLLHTVQRINGGILWANLHLLFWLSLFPFITGWMGQNYSAAVPTVLYGCVLLLASIAYLILERVIIASEGADSLLARAVGSELKGRVSVLLYVIGIGAAFYSRAVAQVFYVSVALMWLIPDRRIERAISDQRRK
jgi:uncharacterized membrane protein